jgi:micrococcal nuclease
MQSWLSLAILSTYLVNPQPAMAERVARVIDGDTVLLEDGRKVRYAGVNAPEQGDPGYQESMHANNLLVGGKEVRLEFGRRRTEKYERLLAYVYVERTLVQAELVMQGWAFVTRAQSLPRYREVLQKYQEEAKAGGRGIWTKGEHRGKLVVVQAHPRDSARSSSNDEYIVFKNVGAAPLLLTGWSVSDEMNQSYLVPQFTVGPGKTFSLYTGPGKNTNEALYWGRRKTVWNKGGDTVIVRDASGFLVLAHTY